MAAQLFYLPFAVAMKATGVGAPGAKAWFFAPGTTTLRTVYSNSGLTVARSNPVVADGAGAFPAIYIDDTLTYKLVITDKNNATLYSRDPYIPGEAPDASLLSPYSDAAASSAEAAANSAAAAASAASQAAETAAAEAAEGAIDAITDAIGGITVLPNASVPVATRVAMAALASTSYPVILTEEGREGIFVYESSDLSALVAADTAQGVYVAPATDTDGSSGAWVRKFDGPLQANWFGMDPANAAAANNTAIQGAIALADALQISGAGYGPGSIGIHIRAGFYNLSATIALENPLRLTGDYTSLASGGGTVLKWSNDVDGISTAGSTGGYYIDGLALEGPQAGTIGTKHGIKARGYVLAQNLFIDGFSGNGIDCSGNFAGDGSNVSGSKFRDIWIQSCTYGTYSDGADANNIVFDNVQITGCRLFGHFDSSFLGCIYRDGMIHACGHDTDYPSVCTYNGHRYMVAPEQETWCSTNAPTGSTTSNQGWLWFSDTDRGVATVAWTSGLTWYSSGPFAMDPDNHNAYSIFDGMYVEPDQNAPVCTWPAVRVAPSHCLQGVLTPQGDEFYYDSANSAGNYWAGDRVVGGQLTATGLYAPNILSAYGGSESVNVGGDSGGPARNAFLNVGAWGGSYAGVTFKINGVQIGSISNDNFHLQAYVNTAFTGFKWAHQTHGDLAYLTDGGFDLKLGSFKVAGTKVLGARGAALPADATDLASAIALVNAIKARLKATGGHGLVAD